MSPSSRCLPPCPPARRRLAFMCLALVPLWFVGMALPHAAVASPADNPQESPEPEDPKRAPTYELGQFKIKNHRPIEHEQLTIMMIVHAEVDPAHRADFEALWPQYTHRARAQVITATRLLPPHELDDPELRVLRRLIYLRLRRVLPELHISQIYISEFGYLVN